MFFSRERRISVAQFLVLVFAGFWAYSIAVYAAFSYDDIPLIIENPHLRSVSGLWELVRSGRPVRGLTLWLDYRLWGLDARGFHFTNIILHILCVLSAFYLLKLVFQNQRLAFLSALFFAVHPVNSEAVVNVAHRKELLCFLFMTLSFIAFKKSSLRFFWLCVSFGFYILALLSKQVALALPVLILIEELVFSRLEGKALKRLLAAVSVYLMVPVLGFVFMLSDFKLFSRFQPADFFEHSYFQILATQMSYYSQYLKLAFLPSHLAVDHYVDYVSGFLDLRAGIGVLALLLSLAVLVRLLVLKSPGSFAWGWFLINLLPVMNFIPSNEIIAERYLYVPSLGAAMAMAVLLTKASESAAGYLGSRYFRMVLLGLLNFLASSLLIAGYHYYARETLWARLPRLEISSGLAFLLYSMPAGLLVAAAFVVWNNSREREEAGAGKELFFSLVVMTAAFVFAAFLVSSFSYQKLLFPIPDIAARYRNFEAWLAESAAPSSRLFSTTWPHGTNLTELINYFVYIILANGVLFMAVNRYGRRLALLKSDLAFTWFLAPFLAAAMLYQARFRTAEWGSEVSIWKATVRENPHSFAGWNNLGRAYVGRKKFAQAIDSFIMAHSEQPYRVEPMLNLGNTMLMLDDLDSAERYYRWALNLSPFSFAARLNLGNCLAAKKECSRAIEQYSEALKIRPDSFEANYNLALCFLGLNDRATALQYLQRSLSIAPNHEPSRALLWQLMQGNPEPAANPGQ